MKHKAKQVDMPSLEQLERERLRCRYRRRYRRTLCSTAAVLIVVAAISVLVAMLWMPVYRVCGSSMAPTLENGQIVAAIKGSAYRQGDPVAFYYGNKLLIKRVAAGPGDTVDIRENGDVYINGVLLNEPYADGKTPADPDMEYPLCVPEEHWFLLGDNRRVSVDSRNKQIGCVSQEQIVGRVVLRIWPPDKLRIFSSGTERESE